MSEDNLSENVVHGNVVAGDAELTVGRQVDDAQHVGHEHSRHLLRVRLALEYLHVADVLVSGHTCRFLVYGRSHNGLDLARSRHFPRLEHPLDGRLARRGGQLSKLDTGIVQILRVHHVDDSGLTGNIFQAVRHPAGSFQSGDFNGVVDRRNVSHHERAALFVDGFVLKGLGGDFGPDSGWVAHGDGDKWSV